MEVKTCKKCGRSLPATKEHYYADKSGKYGLRSRCKSCENAQKEVYRKRSKETFIARSTHYQETHENRNKTCSICGSSFPATKEYFYTEKLNIDGLRNDCKQCCKAYDKRYYAANKPQKLARDKQYRKEHKDDISKKHKVYWQITKPIRNARQRAYYKENREDILKKLRQYYEAHKEEHLKYSRYWYQNNKDKVRIIQQSRKAKKRELPATLTEAQWEQTKAYFNNCCAYCGRRLSLTQDHFIPLSKGGAYTQENIIPACNTCNSSKQDKDFEEWYPTYKYFSEERADTILYFMYAMKNGE